MRDRSVRHSSDQWYVSRVLFDDRYVKRRRRIAIVWLFVYIINKDSNRVINGS